MDGTPRPLSSAELGGAAPARRELARAVAVTKRYGEITAVAETSCRFEAGVLHAVCGENGAGKSTLLKIVGGILRPDGGSVVVGGSRLEPHTVKEAVARGVAMVLQHFALVGSFTALENVALGVEPTRALGLLDRAAVRRRAERVALDVGFALPWDERVSTLSLGDRQRLEIVRALFREATLLILDEPTAVLTRGEANQLYATLRALVARGVGVVVVTHKLDEVREHADVVTVLRRGSVVFTTDLAEGPARDEQVDEVASAVMGAPRAAAALSRSPRASAEPAAAPSTAERRVVLEMRDVRSGRDLDGLSLTVGAGEIVGIAGVEGNGQRELVALLAGDIAPDGGTMVAPRVAIVREDRQGEGLVLDGSVRDNLVLGELRRFAGRAGLLDATSLDREARARVEAAAANVDLERPARTLSGGNQQKIVVARAIARMAPSGAEHAVLLVVAQPTRGVDIGAAAAIHARLRETARDGNAVLLISTDLDELRALSGRIVVLARGRLVAEVSNTATDDEIGRLMMLDARSREARPS